MKHPFFTIYENDPSYIDMLVDKKLLRLTHDVDRNLLKINYEEYVREQDFDNHPILNDCRGDIIDYTTGEIVARAPRKFWTLDVQKHAQRDMFDWNNIMEITQKLDGHLIIPYVYKDEVYFSSRWSFTSETCSIAEKYATPELKMLIKKWIEDGIYPIFELIDPHSFIKVIYQPHEYGLWFTNSVCEQGLFTNTYAMYKYLHGRKMSRRSVNYHEADLYIQFDTVEEIVAFVNQFDHGSHYEGVVVTFNDGRAVKIKANKYFEYSPSKLVSLDISTIYDATTNYTIYQDIEYIPTENKEKIKDISIQLTCLRQRVISDVLSVLISSGFHNPMFLMNIDGSIGGIVNKSNDKIALKQLAVYMKQNNIIDIFHCVMGAARRQDWSKQMKSAVLTRYMGK